MSTIKQIAQLAGVSRGTVDRVLNNRGAVHPDTARRVMAIAQAVNYTPNLAGKTLAVKKKQLKFGFVLFGSSSSNPFFEDVERGIKKRAAELQDYGVSVEIRYSAIDSPRQQVERIDQLVEAGIDGLAITPLNHPSIRERITALCQAGIPVVTVNTDIPDCERVAYVGSDYYKSGETAAGLMNLVTGGQAAVGIIIGSPWVLGHSMRVAAFTEYTKRHCPGIRIVDSAINNDDDLESFSVTMQMLRNHPEMDALFLAAAGVQGACKAVKDLGLGGKLKIISYDTVPTTRALVEDGTIIATIGQQAFTQGTKPLDLLLDVAGMDIPPEKEHYYTKIEIKIKENL